MALTDIFSAIRSSKNTIAALDKKIGKLAAERAEVAAAPAHLDDVLAWAKRGLDAASADFLGRLSRWHFNAESLGSWSGQDFDGHPGPQLLSVTAMIPNGGANPTPGGAGVWTDPSAVTHFLRPAIEAALPKLIADAYPQSKGGMRSDERRAKLARIDAQLDTMRRERAELAAEIEDAARAIKAPAAAIDSDAAIADAAERAEAMAALARGEVATVGEH
jgi:hypothetical protein